MRRILDVEKVFKAQAFVVRVNGNPVSVDVDHMTGLVTFSSAPGAQPYADFLFDVPVRFDTDYLEIDLSAFAAGAIPHIPLVEIKP